MMEITHVGEKGMHRHHIDGKHHEHNLLGGGLNMHPNDLNGKKRNVGFHLEE